VAGGGVSSFLFGFSPGSPVFFLLVFFSVSDHSPPLLLPLPLYLEAKNRGREAYYPFLVVAQG